MSPARDWDARSYDRISGPMEALGREVLDRLELQGDETVLDAGCGTGRVTEVADRAPAARPRDRRRRLGGDDRRRPRAPGPGPATLRVADLLELELGEPVDAILSTATFHWIADHPRLFARLHAALRPGGALVAQCGGIGNVAAVHAAAEAAGAEEPFAAHLAGWRGPVELLPARRGRGAPGGGGLPRRPRLAAGAPGRARRAAGVPAHDRPRRPPRAPAARARRAVHRRPSPPASATR